MSDSVKKWYETSTDEIKSFEDSKIKTDIINSDITGKAEFREMNPEKFKSFGFGNEIHPLSNKELNKAQTLKRLKESVKQLEGQKFNETKLPMSKLFIQFPRALQAIVLASCYGNSKYPNDIDWKNFERVEGGSTSYLDAQIRHKLDEQIYGQDDSESELFHIFHELWNKMAECELFIRENNIDIKEYSKKYLKKLAEKQDNN